ncbi:MAG: methyltransferase [Candidatus Micrarchaeia archaeon]
MYEYCGLKLDTSEDVYGPAEDTLLAVEASERCIATKPEGKGIDALDMGCGTGLIGLCMAKSAKVRSVVLADISENAVNLASSNIVRNGMTAKAKAVRSNLFENISGRFDIMVFNAPYLRSDESEPESEAAMLSGGSQGIELSLEFLKQAKSHSGRCASVVLVASSLGNLIKLEREAAKLGYSEQDKLTAHYFFEDIVAFVFALRGA